MTINDPAKCCGCGACYSACPNGSISMQYDAEGFLYPTINAETCLHCDLCETVCPVLSAGAPAKNNHVAFAARTNDVDALVQSTSGGIAFELASYVLRLGGVVYGACFDEAMRVVHQEITDASELKKLQGSKYVQSDIGNTYACAKQHLQKGDWVLFTGSPCQIEGLYSFLRKEYPTLITMDFICHGVPAPGLWEQYLNETAFSSAKNIVFREKSKGWETNSRFVVFDKNNRPICKQSFYKNPFYFFFANNYSLRPICYECPFKTGYKKSDFTVGDLWGISKLLPNKPDDRGMSLVLLNSEKAADIFEKLAENIDSWAISYDDAIAENMMFLRSVTKPQKRALFFKEIQSSTFKKLYGKYKPKDPPILAIKKKLYPIKQLLKTFR